MNTSKYEIIRLLEERRELEWKLYRINQRLLEIEENPFEQKIHHTRQGNGGLPVVGDFINLMIDTLERAIRWIVKQVLR